jgi:hypothetical protein
MRYYETLADGAYFGWNRVDGSQTAFNWIWKVRKRIVPTVTWNAGLALTSYVTTVDGTSWYNATVNYLDFNNAVANARM